MGIIIGIIIFLAVIGILGDLIDFATDGLFGKLVAGCLLIALGAFVISKITGILFCVTIAKFFLVLCVILVVGRIVIGLFLR